MDKKAKPAKRAPKYSIADFMKGWKANSTAKDFTSFTASISKHAGRGKDNEFTEAQVEAKIEHVKTALRGTGIKSPPYPAPKSKQSSITARQAATVMKAAMVQKWFEHK